MERRDEIERELAAIDAREEEIESRLHDLGPSSFAGDGTIEIEDLTGRQGARKSEWNELVAEQVSLINQRWRLFAEFSALTTTVRGKEECLK